MNQPERPNSPSPYESFDSEMTVAEDPGCNSPEPALERLHWSVEPQFQKDVKSVLAVCKDAFWYEGVLDNLHVCADDVLDFDLAYNSAISFIRHSVQSLSTLYKIGITSNPHFRFEDKDFKGAYIRDKNRFSHMKIIWIACKSNKHVPESSGHMEEELIKIFNRDTCSDCLNKPGSGGECPAKGDIHFCYVVW
jgi:hypothetical protein